MSLRKREAENHRGRKEGGFTLIELLAAAAILMVLCGTAAPKFYAAVEENKRAAYEAEALQVYAAAELYLDDACSRGNVDSMTIYQDLIMTDLSDPENGLWEYTHGFCTEDGRLNRVSLNRNSTELTAVNYVVGGYEIEVKKGKVVETERKGRP